MSVEVWFFKTSYLDLIHMRDWKGVLLKAHINWLGQELTHCALRVNLKIDMIYQATWLGLLCFELNSLIIKPTYIVDVTDTIDTIYIIDKLQKMFMTQQPYGVTLRNLLHLMHRNPHKVEGILCTSFIFHVLHMEYNAMDLYPDNCYKVLKEHASKGKT